MKIRSKLTLALSFLFLLILLLGGISAYYLHALEHDAQMVIRDNYRTLTYMYDLNNQLDKIQQTLLTGKSDQESKQQFQQVLNRFEAALNEQKQNVTEPGEQQMTDELTADFKKLSKLLLNAPIDEGHIDYLRREIQPLILQMERLVNQIYSLNHKIIAEKNRKASQTAHQAMLYVMLAAAVGVFIGLLFTLGIPPYIARPIRNFAEAIRQIARGNYKYQLPVNSADEFGDLSLAFNKMAAKLQEYEHSNMASVIFEKKRLDSVINHMNEAIIGFDENKYVIFVNTYALRLLGLKKEDVVGRHAPEVASANHLMHEVIGELMIGFEEWEEKKKFRSISITVDGEEKLFSKNIVDIVDQLTGETRKILIGHIIILSDITEFAERDIAKSQFITTLSHELQTPVDKIETNAELLQSITASTLTKQESGLLENIRESNGKLKYIIKEHFDLDNIDQSRVNVHVSAEDLKQLIDQSIESVKYHMQGKELSLQYSVGADLPMVNVDAGKLVWVMSVLLTNAIRSSPVGKEIAVKAIADDDFVHIKISDQGVAIAKEDRDRTFNKFSRINGQKREKTGLGLVISKEFIEAMGGSVGIGPMEGGNELWIKVPVY